MGFGSVWCSFNDYAPSPRTSGAADSVHVKSRSLLTYLARSFPAMLSKSSCLYTIFQNSIRWVVKIVGAVERGKQAIHMKERSALQRGKMSRVVGPWLGPRSNTARCSEHVAELLHWRRTSGQFICLVQSVMGRIPPRLKQRSFSDVYLIPCSPSQGGLLAAPTGPSPPGISLQS